MDAPTPAAAAMNAPAPADLNAPARPFHTARQHSASAALLEFFDASHLPDDLAPVSQAFADLAERLADTLPADPMATKCLDRLLSAKDCAVRAMIVARRKRA